MSAAAPRRGFTLVEMVTVLALMGLLVTLFVAVRHNGDPMAGAAAALTSTSTLTDAVHDTWQDVSDAAAPACAGADTSDPVSNQWAFADPCTLAPLAPGLRVVASNVPSSGPGVVSVGAAAGSGSWQVTVVAARPAVHGQAGLTCQVSSSTIPAGASKDLTFAVMDVSGCTAIAGAAQVAAVH